MAPRVQLPRRVGAKLCLRRVAARPRPAPTPWTTRLRQARRQAISQPVNEPLATTHCYRRSPLSAAAMTLPIPVKCVEPVDGTYEFEVLSLREYFAARFLYHNAGEDNTAFDSTTVLRELLRRPHWLNTARFYGGNAKGNGIYPLTAGIEEELAQNTSAASYLAAWALLTDGVFLRRPREARKILTALCSDTGIKILLSALDRRDIIALPELPDLPDEDGHDPTWVRLTTLISNDPTDNGNTQRVRALRELLNERSRFGAWWYAQLIATIGTPQQNAWLRIGAQCEAGAGVTASFPSLSRSTWTPDTPRNH